VPAGKAFAVDAASTAVSDLSLLVGAAGWVAGSRLEKAVRDLRALQYADGIHDSLYRSAGRALMPPPLSRGGAQPAGAPFSSEATVPAAAASRDAAIRRATSGVTIAAT